MSSPQYYEDYVAGGNKIEGYITNAFLFCENNNKLLRSSKNTKSAEVYFTKDDFDDNFSGEYEIIDDIINTIFDKGKEWEFKESFALKDNVLKCIKTNGSGLGRTFSYKSF